MTAIRFFNMSTVTNKNTHENQKTIDNLSYSDGMMKKKFPKVNITIRFCFQYGSLEDITYQVFALSENVQDLFELVDKINVNRLTLVGSPRKLLQGTINHEISTSLPSSLSRGRYNQEDNHDDNNDDNDKHSKMYDDEYRTKRPHRLSSLVRAFANLQVLELGYEFKLFKKTALFLHQALTQTQCTIEHLNLGSHTTRGVNGQELDEAIDILANALKKNRTLKLVSLAGCCLSDRAVAKLVLGLANNAENLTKLNLAGNGCREKSMKALGILLAQPSCRLQYLVLSSLEGPGGEEVGQSTDIVSSEEVEVPPTNGSNRNNGNAPTTEPLDLTQLACPGLECNASLQELRLLNCPPLVETGVQAVLDAVRKGQARMRGVGSDHADKGMQNQKDIIQLRPSLEKIVLGRSDELTSSPCRDLVQVPGLKHLDLSCCQLSGGALEALGTALLSGGADITIAHLDLRGNDFGDFCPAHSMERFARGVAANSSLRYLSLESCRIGDECIVILAQSLPSMKNLIGLNLDLNAFDVRGAQGLVAGLQSNKTLRSLSVATHAIRALRGRPKKMVTRFLQEHRDMQFYVALNRCGRILLEVGDLIPPGLWPLILAKVVNCKPLFANADPIVGLKADSSTRDDMEAADRLYRFDAIYCLLQCQGLI